jgi:hypothetical protein
LTRTGAIVHSARAAGSFFFEAGRFDFVETGRFGFAAERFGFATGRLDFRAECLGLTEERLGFAMGSMVATVRLATKARRPSAV